MSPGHVVDIIAVYRPATVEAVHFGFLDLVFRFVHEMHLEKRGKGIQHLGRDRRLGQRGAGAGRAGLRCRPALLAVPEGRRSLARSLGGRGAVELGGGGRCLGWGWAEAACLPVQPAWLPGCLRGKAAEREGGGLGGMG